MKSKLFLICFAVIFFSVISFSAPLFAKDRLADNAGLLSPSQASELREKLDRVSETYNFDLVIVTETDIGNTRPMNYADDFFDYNGYGFGEDFDGCLFLQVTESRDYWFSTCGRGIDMVNATAYEELDSNVLKNLKKDEYYKAYLTFVDTMEVFLKLDAKGQSYGIFQRYFDVMLLVSWVISLLVGLGIVASWKSKMNTALLKTEASPYIVQGSLAFTDRRERFLYSRVSKTAIPKSSSSGGGGSHTSSSGRSHGGGGGKY